jgi:cystathionine beta-lyase/cystathionine gamma-synthase
MSALATKLIHAGELKPRIAGAVTMPVFQSSTFEYGDETDYHEIKYLRLNNTPNHVVLGDKLAVLEDAESGLVTASGMAAISASLLTVLSQGDHLLAQYGVYGGTHTLITESLPRFGIEHDFVDGANPADWERKVKPNTKAIYVETIANPLLNVPELNALVEFAKAHKLITLIDNTVASPVNFRPAELGIDVSLHSGTKYLNGHNDLVAGAVIGRADLVEEIRRNLNHFGGCLDPHTCFLLHRGMKTLAVRMRHHNESALAIAEFLDKHDAVDRVHYPGLCEHPSHERAQRLMDGFSGLVSFEVHGDAAGTVAFLKRLEIPILAVSLGGVDSLISRPAAHSHAGLTPAEREEIGIKDTLVRLSVGLEATEDLMADLDRALAA